MSRIAVSVLLAIFSVVHGNGAGARALKRAQAQSTSSFIMRVQTAANSANPAAMERLSAAATDRSSFRWTALAPNMLAGKLHWNVGTLSVPGLPGTFVTVSQYHPCESAGDHLYPLVQTSSGMKLGAEVPETDPGPYRVVAHRLTVHFLPTRHAVEITDFATLRRRSELSDQAAPILRISSIYTITTVRIGGHPTPFTHSGGFVGLPASALPSLQVELRYRATISGTNEDYVLANQAALTSYWYAHTARLPATCDVQITAPRSWTTIGQGELTGSSRTAEEATTRWHNRISTSYLTVAAGKFHVTHRRFGNLTVYAYLMHASAERARTAISTAAGALQWFGAHFAPFPYSRYAIVESDPYPAALECYSFTLMGRALIPLAIVHEVSHTWWGGMVPNTYTESLWNESFAEYSDGLYGRQTGAGGLREFTAPVLGAILASGGWPSLAEARDAMDEPQSIVGYGKGSLVLQTLEDMLTPKLMIACMHEFVIHHVPGIAAGWQDFVEAVAETAGDRWRGFFTAWLASNGEPDLQLLNVTVMPYRAAGRYVVTGTIHQTVPAFWVRLPLQVATARGSTLHYCMVTAGDTPFTIPLSARPTTLSLDPAHTLMRTNSFARVGCNLFALQRLQGQLLVVYGTGEGAADSNKAAAGHSLATLYPHVIPTVKADTDVTIAELNAGSVLLFGTPRSLRLPTGWLPNIGLTFTGSTIGCPSQSSAMNGPGIWGFAIVPHPVKRGGAMVALAAGVPPAALTGFLHQQELDSQSNRFIVTDVGAVLLSEQDAVADPTVVKL